MTTSDEELAKDLGLLSALIIGVGTMVGAGIFVLPGQAAAAALYAAGLLCNKKRTQQEVADVAQVTEETIRNRYQEQIDAMGIH